jgi:hypothetical protein
MNKAELGTRHLPLPALAAQLRNDLMEVEQRTRSARTRATHRGC